MDAGKSDEPKLRRFTADEVFRMVELGIIGEQENVELLDGVLVEMSPQGAQHVIATTRMAERLRSAYGLRFQVLEEKPLVVSAHDVPEPDVTVVRGRLEDLAGLPRGSDAILVVEVASTSQRKDRAMASTYARAGIEAYWLLDLAKGRLELRTTPADGAYQVVRILGEDDVVDLPESDVRWAVRDLLPRP